MLCLFFRHRRRKCESEPRHGVASRRRFPVNPRSESHTFVLDIAFLDVTSLCLHSWNTMEAFFLFFLFLRALWSVPFKTETCCIMQRRVINGVWSDLLRIERSCTEQAQAEWELDYGCGNTKWRLNPLYVSILESNVLCLILMWWLLGKSCLASPPPSLLPLCQKGYTSEPQST